MKYKIWDSISYGELEPLTPFTKIYEADTLGEITDYIDTHNKDNQSILFVTQCGNILYDTSQAVYESPDNGKTLYKRNFLSDKKIKINK